MLKIASYVYPSALVEPGGLGMLTLHMTRALAQNSEIALKLLISRSDLPADGMLGPSHPLGDVPCVGLPWKRRTREACWLLFNRPLIDRYLPPGTWIYNSSEPAYVPSRYCPRIVTVHHLEPSSRRLKKLRFRKAIQSAELLVAQSSFTRDQVAREYGLSHDRIVVVGSGVERRLIEEGEKELPAVPYPQPYIIAVGALLKRKGGDYLLNIARELDRRGVNLKIICSGGLRGRPDLVEEGRGLPALVQLDYVSRAELNNLIRGAVCMVIPSRLEGFGLTAIEAMALGTPIIASDNSALPETLAGSGVLVDPANAVQIVDEALRFQKDLNHRADYVERGKRRILYFTWEACMGRLLDGIRKREEEIKHGRETTIRRTTIIAETRGN
jgi:glycosyltransferase involved in cell wall biosynthesis